MPPQASTSPGLTGRGFAPQRARKVLTSAATSAEDSFCANGGMVYGRGFCGVAGPTAPNRVSLIALIGSGPVIAEDVVSAGYLPSLPRPSLPWQSAQFSS